MKRCHRPAILVLACALGPLACVDGTLPQRTAQHPGSPNAAEGPTVAPLTLVEEGRHEHAGDAGREGQTTVYTCPMHADVASPLPGGCPKCGMKLVPQPAPPKQGPAGAP
jgi:hypothetical protein